MSAKKPMLDERIMWHNEYSGVVYRHREPGDIRVRVVDARELTAEKAVERVLQEMHERRGCCSLVRYCASAANMTATVKSGKVTVRKAKR